MTKSKEKAVSLRRSLSDSGIGHVGLRVSNLNKSCEFYRQVLGLSVKIRNQRTAYVLTGSDVIVLQQDDGKGLDFHFGFRLDSRSDVEKWHEWIEEKRLRIHQNIRQKTHPRSFKVKDPDGYLIEISSKR